MNPSEKRCPSCKCVKDIDLFSKDSSNRDGRDCWCKECKSKRSKHYKASQRTNPSGRMSAIRNKAQARLRNSNRPSGPNDLITTQALFARFDGTCEYTGQPLDLCKHRDGVSRNHLSPSLDQFVAGMGYNEDNVIITSTWLNMAKGDTSWDTLRLNMMDAVARMVTNHTQYAREFEEALAKLN